MVASLAAVATLLPLTALPSQATDWLVHPPTLPTSLEDIPGTGFRLTNGLVARTFFVGSGAFCTVDLRQLPSGQSFFRALAPEANLSLSIRNEDAPSTPLPFDIGGCTGQPEGHFEFFDIDQYLGNLSANASAFQYVNHSTSAPDALFEWEPRRGAPTNLAWPPKGLHLTVDFVAPEAAPRALRALVVSVHYEMYDGLPTLRKWVSVTHRSGDGDGPAIVVDSMHYELLRAPNWAPEHLTVHRQQANNPTPFNQQIVPDRAHVATLGRTIQMWHADPQYDQCCDKELHVPYSAYTLLAVGYASSDIYGGPTGPGALLHPGESFESLSVRLTLHDSTDIERQGLGIRQMLRTLAPSLNESPLLGMLTDASNSSALRTFVDQMAETGHELAIIGFGAKGWCGMCRAQLTNATFKAWVKGEVQYAARRGVALSAYTLMQHNGWGEETPVAEQTLNRDGTRGPTACFATDFHRTYRQQVLAFIKEVGLGGLETDGQFEGIACADESHDHHHNGLAGGWSKQMEATLGFNKQLKALGVYQTGADGYAFSGAQRWNHADTDQFGHLPIWEMMTVGRMYTFDSTITRVPTSGQIGVNDLVRTLAHCERGPRLRSLDFLMGSLYIFAGQPNFRADRIYDPSDPERAQIVTVLSRWTSFFKRFRQPRPSGAPGLLVSKMLHLLRPNARDLEACVHVSPDASTTERALLALVNPTRRTLTAQITVPLWYTGLAPGTKVQLAPLDLTQQHDPSSSILQRSSVPSDPLRGLGAPSAAAPLPLASGHAVETHVLGGDPGGGFTDVVVKVRLAPASYAVLLGTVVAAE